MNTCECGGEVFIEYREGSYVLGCPGNTWQAYCMECGRKYPLKANNRNDAIREWNNRDLSDAELFKLVRENYAKANKEYIAEQIKEARKHMDNEHWLNSLNTEEKASFLKEVSFCCNTCSPRQFEWYKQHKDECPLKMACAESNGHINWLKEKHTE